MKISFKELEFAIFYELLLIGSVSLKRPAEGSAKDQNILSSIYPDPYTDRERIGKKIAVYTRENSFSKTADHAKTDFVQTGAFISKLLLVVIIALLSQFP